jgi:hypothetical protein
MMVVKMRESLSSFFLSLSFAAAGIMSDAAMASKINFFILVTLSLTLSL